MKQYSPHDKKLRIAQVPPLWFPVPPVGYGGTELIVSELTEGLVKRGHKVTLFASGDSKTKARLVSIIKKNAFILGVPWLHDSYNIGNLIEAFSRSKEFDIIHTHIDVFDPIMRHYNPGVPSVATLHNPFWPMPNDPKKNRWWATYQGRVLLYNRFPNLPYVGISNSYRRQCPADINFVKTIYHGVNERRLKFNPRGGDHFIWLGRISQAKGTHLVVRIAKEMGINLVIAGATVNPEAKWFFKTKIRPYLGKKIKFIGELKTDKEKSELFGGAKAFLYPLQWEEPFGITMIESMACGTPVIAFRRGSVPEIVVDGKTGFIVDDIKEFKGAIKKIDEIKRVDCRTHVEKNFTLERMVDQYEELYYSLIKKWEYREKN